MKIKEFGNAEFEFRKAETNLSELCVSAVKHLSTAEAQRARRVFVGEGWKVERGRREV